MNPLLKFESKMEERDSSQEELLAVLDSLSGDAAELEILVNEFRQTIEAAQSNQSNPGIATDLKRQYAEVTARINNALLQSTLALSLVGESEVDAPTKPQQVVESEEPVQHIKDDVLEIQPPHKMFELFISRELEIIDPPYPPRCGGTPHDGSRLAVGSFVAHKLGSEYALCYVAGYKNGQLLVIDSDIDKPEIIEVDPNEVIALPDTLPNHGVKDISFKPGTLVKSLWQEEDGYWTSTFYEATVVSGPLKNNGKYKLRFDDDSTNDSIDIPEQFVILNPDA